MLQVGLTGGIASGKSAVAEFFANLGAGIVDTDQVARDVVAPGQPGLEAVRREFGASVMQASGGLDRRALRAVVFEDPEARKILESLLHPLIRAQTLEQLRKLRAPYAIAVVPLLVETGFGDLVDRVAVVDCSPETQLERLVNRDGIGLEQAQTMMGAQSDRRTRLAAADDVIDNDGNLQSTRRQVRQLHTRYSHLTRGVASTQQSHAE